MNEKYVFTRAQLTEMLYSIVWLYVENREVHGQADEQAQAAAVGGVLDGIDAERELFDNGELVSVAGQVYPVS